MEWRVVRHVLWVWGGYYDIGASVVVAGRTLVAMKKPSAATVLATLALFVALGGTSYAAVTLAPNSVGSTQLKDGAVQSSDIKDGSIGSGDISNGAIEVSDLSTAARKGFDGKGAVQGPAGPAGPAGKDGAQGPAGPAGPAGPGASAALTVKDATGTTVANAYNPTVDWGTRIVSRFYLYKNGLSYEANGTTGQVVEYAKPQGLLYMGGDVITPANNDVWMLTSALDYPGELIANPSTFGSALFRATDETTVADFNFSFDHFEIRSTVIRYMHPGPGDRLVKLAPVANVAPLVTLPVPFRIGVDDTTY